MMRHRRTRVSVSRYSGSTLPAAPSHAINVLTPSFSIVMRDPLVVYDELYPLHPDVPSTRLAPKTAFTATSSSGAPIDTREVSTQLVPRSGGREVAAAAEVAVHAAATSSPAA